MKIKKMVKWYSWKIYDFLRGYRMCRCRDIVPRKELKDGLCDICQDIYKNIDEVIKE